ncbi:MAG: FAD-dependent thymidylate synthase [Spirochaetes bacterium]|nr:FAD-dependent thymidylate synthase [Spirochaetota bacterium]
MNVKLLSFTPDPEKVVAYSANLCYSKTNIEETINKFYDINEIKRLINLLIEKNHLSPFEHVNFTFGIEGISRVTSHQLVRHRIASYSQQSQRYVKYTKENFDYVIPDTIKKSKYLNQYNEYIKIGQNLYEKMINDGIPKEDARYIFPNATKTNIIATFNGRSLLNFFELRCCYHSQWEIRRLAYAMLKLVKEIAPNLFSIAGPSCKKGICRENDENCPLYRSRLKKK